MSSQPRAIGRYSEDRNMPVVRIPTPLRPHAGGLDRVETPARRSARSWASLAPSIPRLRERLFDGDELRRFVNVYVNNEDIRYLEIWRRRSPPATR